MAGNLIAMMVLAITPTVRIANSATPTERLANFTADFWRWRSLNMPISSDDLQGHRWELIFSSARSLELAVTMARDLDGDDDDDGEADRLRGRGHQSYLARGVDVLAKRPDELSLAQVEAALRRTKRELRAVNRANQAIPTDAPRIPVPKEYRDAEYPVSLAPDLDGCRRPAPRVVMFREGDVWKRRLAKPAPRHRRPPPERGGLPQL